MVAEAAHSWADTGNEVFLLIARGLVLHQTTGDAIWDGGLDRRRRVAGVVAFILILRNGQFLVGQAVTPESGTGLAALLEAPDVDRVTFLHMGRVARRGWSSSPVST